MQIFGRGRATTVAFAAVVVAALGAGASPAMAAGQFNCSGTALRIGASSISAANPQFAPCATDVKAPINTTIPLGALGYVAATGLAATTQANNPTIPGIGHGGNSQGGTLGVQVKIGPLLIAVGAVRSLQFATCTTGNLGPATPEPQIVTAPNSDTLGLSINNGPPLQVAGPLTLPLGIATVYLNRTINVGTTRTRRAVEIQSPLLPPGGIVIAESVIGYTGNPCSGSTA